MIRLIRIVGFLLIGAGIVVLLVWMIEPLRFIWPWLRALPWPIQLGFVISALGLLVLMGSLIWERMEERGGDRELRDEL